MTDYKKQKILTDVKRLLEKQTLKGLKKYGTTVDPNALSAEEWIDHTSEEIIDTLVYLRCLKERLKDYERRNNS